MILFRAVLLVCFLIGGAAWAEPSEEAAALRAARGTVKRDGAKLILHITGGPDVVFVDEDRCDAPDALTHCVAHRLIEYDPIHRDFVVENTYWESRDYFWVSATSGATVSLSGPPYYSPNGTRFVTVFQGDMIGPTGVDVWRMVGGVPVREWIYEAGDDAYRFIAWQGNEEADLAMAPDWHDSVWIPTRLIFDPTAGQGWRLTKPAND